MKSALLSCLVAGSALQTLVARAQVISERFLDALAQVESGNDSRKLGRAGERGAYQFRAIAWRQCDRLEGKRRPHLQAHNAAIARQRARIYLTWLCQQYWLTHGTAPDTAVLYALWNLGPTGLSRIYGHWPAIVRDSANRINTLLRHRP